MSDSMVPGTIAQVRAAGAGPLRSDRPPVIRLVPETFVSSFKNSENLLQNGE